ncbi:MAG TPA: hypothetical protein VFU29_09740 [Chitinophagaceae bacterium]|nr:hypothetical protein [Chitinophagaceae bacterium]
MEFEELRKIWDTQNNQLLYAINEKAINNLILSKKKQAHHITNISELLLIFVNIGSGILILALNVFKQSGNISLYVLSAWMLGSALYILVRRIQRIKGNQQFDRTVSGDLSYAISEASYQVGISQIMRWNILPVATLTFLGLWEGGKSIWIAIIVLLFFALTFYAGGWEHNIYKKKKRELEILQRKLGNEG